MLWERKVPSIMTDAGGAVVAPRGPSRDMRQQGESKHAIGNRNVWLQGREICTVCHYVSYRWLWMKNSLRIPHMWIHNSWRVFLYWYRLYDLLWPRKTPFYCILSLSNSSLTQSLLAILKCKHTKNIVLIDSFYGKIHKTNQSLYTTQNK